VVKQKLARLTPLATAHLCKEIRQQKNEKCCYFECPVVLITAVLLFGQ